MTETAADPTTRASRRAGLIAEARETVRLAVPLALTQVGQIAMFTTDLALIGRLGDEYLAAAALAHTILFAGFIAGMGVVAAVAPLTAQALGAHDARMVRRSLRVGLHASLLLGLPLVAAQIFCGPLLIALGQDPGVTANAVTYLSTLAWSIVPGWMFMAFRGYMSALGVPNPGLWIMAAGIPLNLGLAYVLIFGIAGVPGFGLVGAGIATTAVNLAMCLAAAFVVARLPALAQYEPLVRLWRADWPQLGRLMLIGGPIAVAFSLEHGLFTASNLMAGAISTSALASHQIALQVASIAFMIPLGFGMAASVRVGNPFGAGDMAAARRAGFVAVGLGMLATTTTTVLTIVFAEAIPDVFLGTGGTQETHGLAAVLLVYAAAFFIVDGCQTIGNGALRGLSDTRMPMVYAGVSFWLVGFPVCWLLGFTADLGARGIWIGLCVGLAAYAGLLLWRFERMTRG